ncbi:hypothetical protein [Parvularcula marina]|uniref:hypothetical protein n=1 Tax=Parvularcula marina TaxID=2292771 RepID=UPI0035144AA9
MNVKEKPLMDATSRTGPLPMPSGPILSGFLAVLCMALMGAFVTIFGSFVYGTGNLVDMYMIARGGAFIGLILASIAIIVTLGTMPPELEEKKIRGGFCLGASIGVVFVLTVDFLTCQFIYDHLASLD